MTDSEVSLSPLTITRFGGKTRDRILRQSLVLLNGEGFQSTTTAALAANSDVKEGTLWYHFRTKNDLVSAHLQILDELLR
ncbi:MAG: helix-turn-helix domain-containing protein, partial [Pseudomonadota bacterium]